VCVVGQGRSRSSAGLQGHTPLRSPCRTTSQAAQTVTQPWVKERTHKLFVELEQKQDKYSSGTYFELLSMADLHEPNGDTSSVFMAQHPQTAQVW